MDLDQCKLFDIYAVASLKNGKILNGVPQVIAQFSSFLFNQERRQNIISLVTRHHHIFGGVGLTCTHVGLMEHVVR